MKILTFAKKKAFLLSVHLTRVNLSLSFFYTITMGKGGYGEQRGGGRGGFRGGTVSMSCQFSSFWLDVKCQHVQISLTLSAISQVAVEDVVVSTTHTTKAHLPMSSVRC